MQQENKMDSFTSRETICRSTTSDVLWIIHLCRRGNRDDNFDRVVRKRGKSLEHGIGDWKFLLVRLMVTESPKILRNQTVTSLNEVLSIEIQRRCI
jgi:hypothetical protein